MILFTPLFSPPLAAFRCQIAFSHCRRYVYYAAAISHAAIHISHADLIIFFHISH